MKVSRYIFILSLGLVNRDRRITTPMHTDRRELIGYDAEVICDRDGQHFSSYRLGLKLMRSPKIYQY
jgi:hypothetical protein